MIKHTYLITVWFLAGWMIGSMAAFVLGIPNALGPIAAFGAALVMAQHLQLLPRVRRPSKNQPERIVSGRAG
jgi:hypothetical protein